MRGNAENIKETMQPDPWFLYRLMLKSRLFEIEVTRLWQEGHIPGEMHLGMGEEAIVAGVVGQLSEGDAMALDHRGTPPLLMRDVDPVILLREFLGRSDGLCRGRGGHMHLFCRNPLAASSGIVGASGPTAAGFALAARYLRPGTVAAAFFGEGAANQGMLMESLNLAAAWKLPVLFICKDNQKAITTSSPSVTGGVLTERARGFGMPAEAVDGIDAERVWHAAHEAITRARKGEGPTFLHARRPLREMIPMAGPLMKSLFNPKGASMARDANIIILGEDVHTLRRNLFVRFGKERVLPTPISEGAFVSAAVAAAMAGLRPVVEVMMVDFIPVAVDALLNHAAKLNGFSGGKWNVPLVVRTACGGGYGDGGRKTVQFDVPPHGARGPVPKPLAKVPIGEAACLREGSDMTIFSVGVGVHRAIEAAEVLEEQGISAGIIDLRTISPLDRETVCEAAAATGRILCVDEDYENFGLSGELAAVVMEQGIAVKYARVCTKETIPFARHLEDQVLPNKKRIIEAAVQLMQK
jgi:pyruvate/2-oxoglutarate/acetoin dehydrogenase E1 component